ncbi:MAG: DUF2520 domain-containing protein [Bacteroidales bacterium]|nr:DUF2520 domain-containing protein [Bacteroidales bacterium]
MIALIGSGNVATWVAQRLRNSKEFAIAQVYSRHLEHAQWLADQVGAVAIDDFRKLDPSCEAYVFTLKDDAYPEALKEIPFQMRAAVHTAGTVSSGMLASYAEHYGVLYPLQTFTKSMDMVDMTVPLCVDAQGFGTAESRLMQLARELSPDCCLMDEKQRAVVHLAAVFACNFSNAMCGAADHIMCKHGLDYKILLPLLRQTIAKLESLPPAKAQTGPAVRRDYSVMEKHLSMLDEDEIMLYERISDYIMKH